jgi:PIN domain nuclease of toxin-antitoxin system
VKFLLDTQSWFWIVEAPDKIPSRVQAQLDATDEQWGLSIMSIWELARKVKIGRNKPTSPRSIILGMPFRDWLKQALTDDISVLPLTPEVCAEANELPGIFHADPVDGLIVATARVMGLTVVTSDAEIKSYRGVKTLAFTPL